MMCRMSHPSMLHKLYTPLISSFSKTPSTKLLWRGFWVSNHTGSVWQVDGMPQSTAIVGLWKSILTLLSRTYILRTVSTSLRISGALIRTNSAGYPISTLLSATNGNYRTTSLEKYKKGIVEKQTFKEWISKEFIPSGSKSRFLLPAGIDSPTYGDQYDGYHVCLPFTLIP